MLLLSLGCQSTPPSTARSAPSNTTSGNQSTAKTGASQSTASQSIANKNAAGQSAAPAAPQPLLGQPTDPPSDCVRQCLQASQMQARAWEAIEAECRTRCAQR